jgi:hypothetical protein
LKTWFVRSTQKKIYVSITLTKINYTKGLVYLYGELHATFSYRWKTDVQQAYISVHIVFLPWILREHFNNLFSTLNCYAIHKDNDIVTSLQNAEVRLSSNQRVHYLSEYSTYTRPSRHKWTITWQDLVPWYTSQDKWYIICQNTKLWYARQATSVLLLSGPLRWYAIQATCMLHYLSENRTVIRPPSHKKIRLLVKVMVPFQRQDRVTPIKPPVILLPSVHDTPVSSLIR